MPLRRRTVQKIHTYAWFAIAYTMVGVIWEYLELSTLTLAGPGVGLGVGVTLAALEESAIADFTRPMPFARAIFAKSIVYLGVIAIPVCSIGFIFGMIDGHPVSEFFAWIFSTELIVDLSIIYLIHLAILSVRHINKLLGPGTLIHYVTGRYHTPSTETRVFMFLDLKSSTSLTEEMGQKKYYAFLNTSFRDMTEPILERSAEIYQYVGDEVVLTWPLARAIRDANCIRAFFEILAKIHDRRAYYLREFGHVPQFKAGIHFGDVIAAEVGDIKKEISYFGDVLNTTARIQAKCNELGHLLIASRDLVEKIQLPNFITPESLGHITLRGKAEATALVGLLKADQDVVLGEPLRVQDHS